MFPMFAACLAITQSYPVQRLEVKPPPARFELAQPLLGGHPVMLDAYNDGMGLLQQIARARNLQGRVIWVDGTANLAQVSSAEKVHALVEKVANAGFNTIVFDIKPISGQVLYKSKIAPKITEWRGQELPLDFDPLPSMVAEAKRAGMQLLVSMNAFSEGHSMFKVGPGYEKRDWQTVIYVPAYVVRSGSDQAELEDAPNKMPSDASHVGVFTDASKIRGNVAWASVDSEGTVLETGTSRPKAPRSGGSIVVGEFVGSHARIGGRLDFDSTASFVPISDHPTQYPLMMNPNNPDVQSYELSIAKEVLENYNVDGFVYDDRLRFGGIDADFSPLTMSLFEKWVGKKLTWPDDVFKFTITPTLTRGMKPGRYYDSWMTWRALQMRNWVARVRQLVLNTRPNAYFGVYAGSWYGEYPALGANYASPDLEAGFWFLTPWYQKTGYAPLLDLLITGCYYPNSTIYDAMVNGKAVGSTVEMAGQLSNRVARDQCWTYAGIMLSDFKGNEAGLEKALQAACGSTQGVMVFDYSHDIDSMLPVFQRVFGVHAKSPLGQKGLLSQIRKKRANYDKWGVRERPVTIAAGSTGAGQ